MNRASMQILWTCICLVLTVSFLFVGNIVIAGGWFMVFIIQVAMSIITIKNIEAE